MDTVDAGWFVDPLGRFSGRFFDGKDWTDQVSNEGVLQIDQDWRAPVEESNADDARLADPDDSNSGDSDSRVINAGGSDSKTSSYAYDPLPPVAPAATQCGGRTDRRQVQIPVSVDRRSSNRHLAPQESASSTAN